MRSRGSNGTTSLVGWRSIYDSEEDIYNEEKAERLEAEGVIMRGCEGQADHATGCSTLSGT